MNALEAWVHCQPSPRFVWRAIAPNTAHGYRLSPKGYYAPMNCYRRHTNLTMRVAFIIEALRGYA